MGYHTGANDTAMGIFTTEMVDTPYVTFELTFKGELSEEDLHSALCILAEGLAIPAGDIADYEGNNCMEEIVVVVEEEPVENVTNETNVTRRLQTTTENTTDNTTNETNVTDVYTSLSLIILPNTNPNAAPEYTTDEILDLDSASLKTVTQTIYGSQYTVSAVSTPSILVNSVPILSKDPTITSTTNSVSISGIQTNVDGVFCWMLYQGGEDISVGDISEGVYNGQDAIDYGCLLVNNIIDSNDTAMVSGLTEATEYRAAYYVRSYDHRDYAESNNVTSAVISTQVVVVPADDEEEESQFILMFGFLSFLFVLLFQ